MTLIVFSAWNILITNQTRYQVVQVHDIDLESWPDYWKKRPITACLISISSYTCYICDFLQVFEHPSRHLPSAWAFGWVPHRHIWFFFVLFGNFKLNTEIQLAHLRQLILQIPLQFFNLQRNQTLHNLHK